MIVKTDGSFAALIVSVLTPTLGPWDIVTRRNGVIIIVIGHNIAPANDTQQAVPRGYRKKVDRSRCICHLPTILIFHMFAWFNSMALVITDSSGLYFLLPSFQPLLCKCCVVHCVASPRDRVIHQ